LAELCITCNTYANFLEGIKKVRDCLTNSLLTERTTLSLSTMSFVEALAKASKTNFGPYLELVMVPLLKITGKSNKVFVRKSVAAINSIITHTKLPAIVPYLPPNLSSKNKQIRIYACEFLFNSMSLIDPKKLNIHVNVIINAIKNGVVDADPSVRTTSKKIFESFKKLYPDSMPDLIAVLCDTAKKNLKITSSSASSVSSSSVSRVRPTAIPRPNPSARPVQPRALPTSSATQRPIATPTSRIAKPTIPSNTTSVTATRPRSTSTLSSRSSGVSSTVPARTSSSTISRPPSSASVKRPHQDVSSTSYESKYMRNGSASSVPSRANTSSTSVRSSAATSSTATSTSARRPIPQRASTQPPAKLSSSQSSETSTGSSSRSSGVASILARSKAVIDSLNSSRRTAAPRPATSISRPTRPTATPSIPFSTKSRHTTSETTSSEQPKKNYFKYDKALEVMAKSRPGVEAPKATTSRTISIPLFNPANRHGPSSASRESLVRKVTEPASSTQSSLAHKDTHMEKIPEQSSIPTSSSVQPSAPYKDRLVEKTASLSLSSEASKKDTSSNKNLSVYDRAVEIMQQTPFPHEFERERERRNREELDRAQRYLVERSKLPIFKRLGINAESDPQYHEVMKSIKSKAQSALESSVSTGDAPLFVYSDSTGTSRSAASSADHQMPYASSSRDLSVYDRAVDILVQSVSGQPTQANATSAPSQQQQSSSSNPGSNSHTNNVTPRTSYSGIGPVDSPPFHLFESMSPRLGRHSVPSSPRNRVPADMSTLQMGKTTDHS
jgi:hypothetical protein